MPCVQKELFRPKRGRRPANDMQTTFLNYSKKSCAQLIFTMSSCSSAVFQGSFPDLARAV